MRALGVQAHAHAVALHLLCHALSDNAWHSCSGVAPRNHMCFLQARLDAVRFINAAIKSREIELRESKAPLTDEEIIRVCACTLPITL